MDSQGLQAAATRLTVLAECQGAMPVADTASLIDPRLILLR